MLTKNKSVEETYQKILDHVSQVIIGKPHVVQLITIGLFCQGHILIEDVPGVGKTMLARSLAKTVGCTFKRIQFTPDMLPSDITGVSIFNQQNQTFEYKPGPIMTQVLLADEINRATPKTQSALLEAMEERTVTVDGITHSLPKPFLVMATQNPIEYEGTFPLPEAQLDRFLLKIQLGYPSTSDEIKILENQQLHHPIDSLTPIISQDEIALCQNSVKEVFVSDSIKRYVIDLVNATRQHEDIYLGASPRGSLGLFKTSQAKASILGRDYVIPEDVKMLFVPVISHRIVVSPRGRITHLTAEQILLEILGSIPIPGDIGYSR